MFGVGENPVYLERLEAREQKKRASGEAQLEAEDARRESLIADAAALWSSEELEEDAPPPGELLGAPASAGEQLAPQEDVDSMLDALYGGEGLLTGEDEEDGDSRAPPLGL